MKILLIVSLLFVVKFFAHAQQTQQPPKAPVAPYKFLKRLSIRPIQSRPLLSRSLTARSGMATTAPCAMGRTATARARSGRT